MSNLLQFKDIELSDKEWADPLLAVSDYRATEYCFTSLYIWARFFGTRIARWKDWLLIRSDGEEGCANYIFPAGSGDIREILGIMEEDAANIGRRMVLWTTAEVRDRIEKALPGHYGFSPIRRSFDYIYETGKMISLSGKNTSPSAISSPVSKLRTRTGPTRASVRTVTRSCAAGSWRNAGQ